MHRFQRVAMNLEQLKLIAEQRETKTVELKSSTASLRGAFESVCAFLNAKGGTVLIGVKDNGELVGQEISDATRLDIAREIKRIEPAGTIHIDYVELKKGKTVIVIQVPVGEHAPYIYDGRPFERNESGTDRMSQHRYERHLIARGALNHAWDEQPALGYDIDSLDHDEIRNTIRDGINKNRIAVEVLNYSIEDMLKYLKLVKQEKLLNAAVVLYAKDVEPDYPQCLIRMTRYRGLDKLSNFMDSKHIEGNTFKLLSEANYFTMRHLPVASFFETDSFTRIDKPALPVMAIREALINAISHRDYTNRSATISMAIFDDRLEIWNNGILPPELKLKDLKKQHESYPRNRRIAKIFYSRGWVEKAGIGTLRIIEDCKELGVPDPEFTEYSSGLAVIFRFKEPMGEVRPTKALELTPRQREILTLLEQGQFNGAQIAGMLKNAPTLRSVQIDLLRLEEERLVKREGKARAMVWRLLKD